MRAGVRSIKFRHLPRSAAPAFRKWMLELGVSHVEEFAMDDGRTMIVFHYAR